MVRKQLEKLLRKTEGERVTYIPLNNIKRNPYQPRCHFDEKELLDLAQSIKAYGVIQPIIARKKGDGYQIIAGERRVRASFMAGLAEIPALIQDMNDEQVAAVSLIENLQRRELNYFEEAQAYSILINIFGMKQEEIARKIGKSQSAIANKLRLLKLPDEVKEIISPNRFSERHARALLKLPAKDMQIEVIKQIYEKELTAKETDQLVERISKNSISAKGRQQREKQNISMIIRDRRIFINTIKETVRRARQTGIEMTMVERENEGEYELVIRILKQNSSKKPLAKN